MRRHRAGLGLGVWLWLDEDVAWRRFKGMYTVSEDREGEMWTVHDNEYCRSR
jgi:hypothetical protein